MSKYIVELQVGMDRVKAEADDLCDIIRKVEENQDFGCVLRMGRAMEDEEGQKELDKLEAFLAKYHDDELTAEDVKELNIKLSCGNINCLEFAEN